MVALENVKSSLKSLRHRFWKLEADKFWNISQDYSLSLRCCMMKTPKTTKLKRIHLLRSYWQILLVVVDTLLKPKCTRTVRISPNTFHHHSLKFNFGQKWKLATSHTYIFKQNTKYILISVSNLMKNSGFFISFSSWFSCFHHFPCDSLSSLFPLITPSTLSSCLLLYDSALPPQGLQMGLSICHAW